MAKKKTKEEFINECNIKHNNFYDYTLVDYIGIKNKIKIICPIHGEFEKIADKHLNKKHGCNKCINCSINKTKNYLNTLIERFNKKHDNFYSYSLINFVNSQTKIDIFCPIHGKFEQTPNNHLNGNGCPTCVGNQKMTKNDFINKAIQKHGNKYDYSLVNYVNRKTKVKIICPIHGEFEQTPGKHIFGQSCSKCSKKYMDTDFFIEKSKEVHNNRYDYSLVDFVNNKTKLKIICHIHGEFKQLSNDHLNGFGCSKCSKRYMDTNLFIEKSTKIHDNKYNYSLVNYINTKTKVKIICPIHGEFEQTPNSHINNKGCLSCFESKGEKEIRMYLKDNNINFISQYKFIDCINILSLPFDFYLPDYNKCIEFQGIQHYEPRLFFGGEIQFEKQKKLDKIKREYCRKNNISLIIIKYNDNVNKKLKNEI
jgi:hypothetical protein